MKKHLFLIGLIAVISLLFCYALVAADAKPQEVDETESLALAKKMADKPRTDRLDGLLDCSNAIPIACGDSVGGDNTGFPSNVDGYSCTTWDESGPEVVYELILTDPDSTIVIATVVGDGCDLDVFMLNYCDEDSCIYHSNQILTTDCLPPGIYYIVVDGYNGAACPYRLEIECSSCGGPGTHGDNCSDPIVVYLPADLPYLDANQTTCGRGNDYSETCLGNYDGGDDIIYELIVTSPVAIDITLDPIPTTWTGICIDRFCPPGDPCIDKSTEYSGSHGLSGVYLDPGSYYIMVDTWPSPDCIPDFDLMITEHVPCVNFCLTPIEMGNGYTFTDTRNSCLACDTVDCIPSEYSSMPGNCGGFCYSSGPDNVYIFTIEEDATITMVVSGDGDNQIMVSVDCGDGAWGTCVYSSDEHGGGADEVIGPAFFPSGTYYVTVSLFDSDECGDITLTVESDQRLPVELTSFEAVAGNAEVTLRWTTASETNNDFFILERNGLEIAQVDGAGNSSTANDYQYVDHSVVNGVTYSYQLVSYDINGTRHEYETVEATPQTQMPSNYSLAQNFPNPFNPQTSISYSLKDAGFVTLKIYNLLGQEVTNLVSQQMDVGQYSVTFDASILPAGIYVYRLEVNDFSAQRKMVLLK